MSINHRIGEHVTRYLVGRDYDVADVQCAKVCYAVESIVGDLQKDLVLFVIFAVSGFFREFLFCFVTVNLVRRFLGGIHMKTNIGCTVASVSVYVIAVAGGVHVIFPYPVVAGLLLFTMYLMATIAPLPSPNRPVYKGERKKKIQQKGLIGLGVLSICSVIYPACSTFIAWILILQIVEVGVVVMRENYLNYKDMDAPPSMSEEAEKLFMECTRNYEARMNGVLHYPTEFRSMTRKERTSAFKGFTDQEKDAVMNLMTDEQKERLVQDIRYQAVLDFRRGK